MSAVTDRWTAVDPTSDRKALARSIAAARETALAGDRASARVMPRSVIMRSWGRCAAHASGLRSAPRACSQEEVADRFASSELAVAAPILRDMLGALDPGDRQLVIVTDAEGTILWTDGAPAAQRASETLGVVPGTLWSETASGTNAMGTALAENHAVQIFASEHLMPGAEGWVCSAAPVCDPETGRQLGVIDLSGDFGAAHPHTLATVVFAARTTERLLAQQLAASHARLRDRWAHRLREGGPVALASGTGTIIDTRRTDWLGRRIDGLDTQAGSVVIDGERLIIDPVDDAVLLWTSTPKQATGASLHGATTSLHRATVPLLDITALGRDRLLVTDAHSRIELSPRHSEILVLLTMSPGGLTDEQVALRLRGDVGRPVSARVELSRLRRALGEHVTTAPYRLRSRLRADYLEVDALTRAGRLADALRSYTGPLLPRSESPAIIELRERIDHGLRSALLLTRDADLLARWLDAPAGEHDIQVTRVLLDTLDGHDPRRAAALSRLRRICQTNKD